MARQNPIDYADLLDVADVLQHWHGGQFTPTYALVSSVFAGKSVSTDLAREVVSELEPIYRKARGKDKEELGGALDMLEYAIRDQYHVNPIDPKTRDAFIAAGAVAGGIGLLLWMLTKLPKKKAEAPAPAPSASPPLLTPVSYSPDTFFVYQRFIDNLDTPQARCTLPQFVFAGSQAEADALARALTTRAPVGGSGNVAVSSNKVVGSECNWRRLPLSDGSYIGFIRGT